LFYGGYIMNRFFTFFLFLAISASQSIFGMNEHPSEQDIIASQAVSQTVIKQEEQKTKLLDVINTKIDIQKIKESAQQIKTTLIQFKDKVKNNAKYIAIGTGIVAIVVGGVVIGYIYFNKNNGTISSSELSSEAPSSEQFITSSKPALASIVPVSSSDISSSVASSLSTSSSSQSSEVITPAVDPVIPTVVPASSSDISSSVASSLSTSSSSQSSEVITPAVDPVIPTVVPASSSDISSSAASSLSTSNSSQSSEVIISAMENKAWSTGTILLTGLGIGVIGIAGTGSAILCLCTPINCGDFDNCVGPAEEAAREEHHPQHLDASSFTSITASIFQQ